jgi:hypothetical protein
LGLDPAPGCLRGGRSSDTVFGPASYPPRVVMATFFVFASVVRPIVAPGYPLDLVSFSPDSQPFSLSAMRSGSGANGTGSGP